MKMTLSKEEAAALLCRAIGNEFLFGTGLQASNVEFDTYKKDTFLSVSIDKPVLLCEQKASVEKTYPVPGGEGI